MTDLLLTKKKWKRIADELAKHYTLMLISKGEWGVRLQFAEKGNEDSPERWCITAKDKEGAIKQGQALLKRVTIVRQRRGR